MDNKPLLNYLNQLSSEGMTLREMYEAFTSFLNMTLDKLFGTDWDTKSYYSNPNNREDLFTLLVSVKSSYCVLAISSHTTFSPSGESVVTLTYHPFTYQSKDSLERGLSVFPKEYDMHYLFVNGKATKVDIQDTREIKIIRGLK